MPTQSPHLVPNLAALAASGHPPMDLPAASPRARVNAGAGGALDIRVSSGGDRWIRLHSARNPQAEAKQWVAAAMANRPSAPVLVVGAGAGYLLEALDDLNPEAHAVLVEPEGVLIRAMLMRCDWTSWLASGRLRILIGPAYEGAASARAVCESDVQPVLLVSPVLAREWPEAVSAASEVARRLIFDATHNRAARRQSAGTYLLNTLRNLPWLAHSGDVAALSGAARGMPAVIAGAGPSLPSNVRAARLALEHMVVISADTALRPLLRLGITPRFVVGLDPTATNARHFDALVDAEDVWLVGEGSLGPGVFSRFPGRSFAFQVSGHQPWPWLRLAGFDRGHLRAWGSVLTAAHSLAVLLECDPIVFIGADMAYTGGQTYSRGTTYEEDWAASISGGIDLDTRWAYEVKRRPDIVTELDVDGRNVTTTGSLRSFRDWFVTTVGEDTARQTFNATGGGIFHGKGVTQIPVSDIAGFIESGSMRDIAATIEAAHQPDLASWLRLRDLGQEIINQRDDAAGAPLSAWDTFVLGTIDRSAMVAAVGEALEGLSPRPPAAPEPDASQWTAAELEREIRSLEFDGLFHPERVAIIAAWLGSAPVPGWVAEPAVSPGASQRRAWLDLAATAVGVLHRSGDLLASAGLPESIPAMEPQGTPASAIADWHPEPRRLVWAAESLIAQILRSSEIDVGTTSWSCLPPPTTPLGPDDTAVAPDCPPSDDPFEARRAFVQIQLVREWMLAAATVYPRDPHSLLVAAVCGAMARRAALRLDAAAGQTADITCQVTLTQAAANHSTTVRMDLQSADLARVFTGWTTPWPMGEAAGPRSVAWSLVAGESTVTLEVDAIEGHDATPRAKGICSRGGVFMSGVLISKAGTLFNHTATLDESSAIATGFLVSSSVRIDEAGQVTELPAWPCPIDAEVPWGNGGSLAWSGSMTRPQETESRIQWRESEVGTPEGEHVPFVARQVLTVGEDTVYWPALTGGLWSWYPGRGGQQTAAGQPLVSAFFEGGELRLEPVDLTLGRVRRVPGENPLGPVWARAEAGGVTAAAHALADCIVVRNSRGAGLALVAYSPLGVAWAGRSLLVLSASGQLMMFEGLRSRVEALRA